MVGGGVVRNAAMARDFLAEFFHEDHGSQNSRVCILALGEPNLRVQELILKYKRVTYLRGDATNAEDLARARCLSADAVFLLVDRFTQDPDQEDAVTVLRALNVLSFNPLIQVFKPVSPLAWLPLVTMLVSALYVSDDPLFAKSFLTSAFTVAM